eukprot:14491945-Ditylum_brightwellii.AAC.1
MGFSNRFPNALLIGPKSMGGAGLTTTDCEQAAEKITAVLRQVRAKMSEGNKFQITLAWAHLQAGVSYAILKHPKNIPYLEGKWTKALIQHLQHIKGTIHLKDHKADTNQRINNKVIMETAYQSKVIPAGWLVSMNY